MKIKAGWVVAGVAVLAGGVLAWKLLSKKGGGAPAAGPVAAAAAAPPAPPKPKASTLDQALGWAGALVGMAGTAHNAGLF